MKEDTNIWLGIAAGFTAPCYLGALRLGGTQRAFLALDCTALVVDRTLEVRRALEVHRIASEAVKTS